MKKTVGILLAFAVAASVFFGCSKPDDKTESAGTLTKITVNAFENSSDTGTVIIGNKLGKVALQSDANFVKEGKKSAEISVVGNGEYGIPYMYQKLDLAGREELSDFSKNVKSTLWVYNADEKDRVLQAEYAFDEGTLGRTQTVLKSEEWTMLNYAIDRQYLPTDESGAFRPCRGIYFYFEISESGEPYKLYFDDLALYRTEKGFNRSTMYLDEHEICSFDHLYQHSLLSNTEDYLDLTASLSISQDYARSAGDFNMKVDAPAGTGDWQISGNCAWPGIQINKAILELFDFAQYDESDSFCFDVYSPSKNGLTNLWITFQQGAYLDIYKDIATRTLIHDKWQTISVSVGEINAQNGLNFADTVFIAVRWGEFTGADRVAYFDNFRMELG